MSMTEKTGECYVVNTLRSDDTVTHMLTSTDNVTGKVKSYKIDKEEM